MTITMQFFNILLEKYQLMTNNTNHIRINDGYYMLPNTWHIKVYLIKPFVYDIPPMN